MPRAVRSMWLLSRPTNCASGGHHTGLRINVLTGAKAQEPGSYKARWCSELTIDTKLRPDLCPGISGNIFPGCVTF